jgi:serine/threonine-protein phosphatase 6 regulatory ankyrin repeat subunit B
MCAASSGKIDIAKILLDVEADVNAKNKRRSTALIIAAWHGRVNMVEALINAGADVSVKNKDGNTAFKIATEMNDQKEIARMLVEAGAVE